MKPLILHVGMPKTGTTSIQSTFFWTPPQPPFRFLSLDTFFGNRAMSTAFRESLTNTPNFFIDTLSTKHKERYRAYSIQYFDKALERCVKADLTPIISAECMWRFEEKDHRNICSIAGKHGLTPIIFCYLRPPIDLAESTLQQHIKTGITPRIEEIPSKTLAYKAYLQRLDNAYGSQNVNLFVFDPSSFPEKCVVKHFCEVIGIDSQKVFIHRENDSINANVARFLFAWNTYYQESPLRVKNRFRRRVILDSLLHLDGPKLRFAPKLVEQILKDFEEQQNFLQHRIGQRIPLSLSVRGDDQGIQRLEDLLEFPRETLEWLRQPSGSRPEGKRHSSDSLGGIVDRLNRLKWTYLVSQTRKYLWNELKLRRQRNRLIQRNLT